MMSRARARQVGEGKVVACGEACVFDVRFFFSSRFVIGFVGREELRDRDLGRTDAESGFGVIYYYHLVFIYAEIRKGCMVIQL